MDDLPPSGISDLDLMRLIERITRKPATLADVKAWRQAIERERARRAGRRTGLLPIMRAADLESAHTLIVDLLMSPDAQVVIAILLAGRSLAEALLSAPARQLYDRMLAGSRIAHEVRADIEGLHAYALAKSALHGRPAYHAKDPAHALPGPALAALNACTPDALRDWRDRLFAARRSPGVRLWLLARLRRDGTDIMRAYPGLDIAHPEAGPPRDLWPAPPPAPSPVSEAETAVVSSGYHK